MIFHLIPSQFPSFSCIVKREQRVYFFWLIKPNEKNKSGFELPQPSLASSFTFYTEKKRPRENETKRAIIALEADKGGWKGWPNKRGLKFYTFFGISLGIKRRMIDIGKK
jgi:hypothetical protein